MNILACLDGIFSLQAFIVSDSDEGEDEESAEDQGLVAPPTERMPSNTPDSRVPTRHPFTERPQLTTPGIAGVFGSVTFG